MTDDKRLVRFDWAMKYMLRDKSNYDIVEGFLCALLEDEKLKVIEILESETNKDDADDKFNRVDVVVKDSKGRKILIEVQNSREIDYLYRILYSTSKSISESIKSGDEYKNIVKVISVNILYFNLGIGDDYLYYGATEFVGVNTNERITKNDKRLNAMIPKDTKYNSIEIYPEYYLIQVEKYQNIVSRAIDEWIYWFKNEQIKEGSKSKYIEKVSKKLKILNMSNEERHSYEKYLEKLATERNILETAHEDGYKEAESVYNKILKETQKREKQARKREEQAQKREEQAKLQVEREKEEKEQTQKKLYESAKAMKENGMPINLIMRITGLSKEEIEK